MIEAYTLESLLKKYGIDATKVINKNNNILEYGEYQDIDKTLNYLVKELHINARNIEKCPSIMYKAVNNIKENYNTDIFGFRQLYYHTDHKYFKEKCNNWYEDIYPNIKLEVKSNIKLYEKGNTLGGIEYERKNK